MISSARMYSVTPAVGDLWRRLLEGVAERAGQSVEVLDWPEPRPLAALWQRPDMAAVFMCGLPFSGASPRPEPVAAPIPALPRSNGQPCYWSEFVVRADSGFRDLSETFGHRIAFTMPESQSGFAGPLFYLMQSATSSPLYREVIAPQITPVGALSAVLDGRAEVAPIDALAFALLRRHAPDLTANVRIVARTESVPIPLLVASPGQSKLLDEALLEAHDVPALQPLMEKLLLRKFVHPQVEAYANLKESLETAREFWSRHSLAENIDPAFHVG